MSSNGLRGGWQAGGRLYGMSFVEFWRFQLLCKTIALGLPLAPGALSVQTDR